MNEINYSSSPQEYLSLMKRLSTLITVKLKEKDFKQVSSMYKVISDDKFYIKYLIMKDSRKNPIHCMVLNSTPNFNFKDIDFSDLEGNFCVIYPIELIKGKYILIGHTHIFALLSPKFIEEYTKYEGKASCYQNVIQKFIIEDFSTIMDKLSLSSFRTSIYFKIIADTASGCITGNYYKIDNDHYFFKLSSYIPNKLATIERIAEIKALKEKLIALKSDKSNNNNNERTSEKDPISV